MRGEKGDRKAVKLTIALFALTLSAQSGPQGSFIGNDFRRAYVPNTTLNGAGQVIGIYAMANYSPSDIAANFALAGLPVPTIQTVQLPMNDDIYPPSGYQMEVTQDILMAAYMAPGATIRVYVGSFQDQILARMAQDRDVNQFSCSWGITPDAGAIAALTQIKAQGQSFFQAAGDYGTLPIAQTAYVTAVGGTVLTTSPGGCRASETAWVNSGVGVVAAVAQNIKVIINGVLTPAGGASAAAPLWAGFMALVNQALAQIGKAPVGWVTSGVRLRSGLITPENTSLISILGGGTCSAN